MTDIPRPSEVLPDWSGHVVAWDTETSGLFCDDGKRLSVVSVAWFEGDEDDVVSYAFPFDQGDTSGKRPNAQLDLFENPDELNLDEAEWDHLLLWLRRQWLVAHNAKFDLHHTREGTRRWAGADLEDRFWWCTMVAQNVIDPIHSLGLEEIDLRLGLSQEGEDKRTKAQAVKSWLKRQKLPAGRYDLVPWGILGGYASGDAVLALQLYAWQMQRVRMSEADAGLLERRMQTLRVLYRMERRGMAYDAKASLAAAAVLRAEMREIEGQLPFRATLPAAKAYFFGDGADGRGGLNHLPYKLTEKGEPALDLEVLRKMREDQLPWAAEWGRWSDLETACSMWYEGYAARVGPDGRLRTSFKQTKVKSGRKSVERINLQAIPKENERNDLEGVPTVRELFRARDGYVLWNLDLQQAELRAAARYANCKLMLQRLERGEDLHGETCKQIIGIDERDRNWKMMRDVSKRLNFGGIFLIGPRTFQATLSKDAGIELPIRECETIVEGWRRLYPEFGRAKYQCEAEVNSTGGIRVLLGTEYEMRHMFKPMDYPHTGWSRRVQGSLAEFLDIWLWEAECLLQEREGCEEALVLTVHDSLVLELPEDGGETVAKEVADLGSRRGTELFKIEMPVDVGRWHK